MLKLVYGKYIGNEIANMVVTIMLIVETERQTS